MAADVLCRVTLSASFVQTFFGVNHCVFSGNFLPKIPVLVTQLWELKK